MGTAMGAIPGPSCLAQIMRDAFFPKDEGRYHPPNSASAISMPGQGFLGHPPLIFSILKEADVTNFDFMNPSLPDNFP